MDQALRAMLHLAGQDGRRASAAEVATALGEPVSSVQQVLQALTRARLVDSKSSGNGGYQLSRDSGSVSLLDIVEAVEGHLDGGRCILRSHPCHWELVCPVHRMWMSAIQAFADGLSGALLSEVLADDDALRAGTLPIPADSHRLNAPR